MKATVFFFALGVLAMEKDWSWIIDWRPKITGADDRTSGSWIHPASPLLHYTGRIESSPEQKPRLIWPGSAIKGRFTGRSLSVQLEDAGDTDYQVIIDGDLRNSTLLDTSKGFHVYPLARDLSPGTHSFELFRRTESFSGVTQVDGFFVDAGEGFLPWDSPTKLRLDFYGDSQTVGACNECGATEQWDDLRSHNHLLSYAALASRMLDADAHITAVSGIGLTLGYQNSTMEQIWARKRPDPNAAVYDFASPADIILVNLGQNDFSRGVKAEVFGPAYARFISELRRRSPNAWILCLSGAMDAAHPPSLFPYQIEEAVRIQNDSRILFHLFKTRTRDHPRVPEHLEMAEELVQLLKSRYL